LERKKLLILIMAYLAAFVYGMVLQSIPPVLTAIIRDLHLSHTQGGLLMSLFALPGVFFSLPGGMLADIHGPKRVGIASLLLMLAGTIMVGNASSFYPLAFGRFLAGIGGTSMVIIGAQALSQAFINDKHMGIAMGIFNTGVPSGTIFAHIVFSRLVLIWDWRLTVFIAAFFCLTLILLFWRYLEPAEIDAAEKGETSLPRLDFLEGFKNRIYLSIWLLSVSWMLYIAAKMALFTFAPDYFITIGYDVTVAGLLTGVFAMGSLIVSPITGVLLGKSKKAETFLILVGAVMAALFMLMVTAEGGHIYIAVVIGLFAALFPVSTFYLVPMFLPVEKLGLGYGILRICENAGILLGPLFVGLIYDISGSYFYGFVLMSSLSLAAAAVAAALILFGRKKALAQRGVA